MFKKIDRIQSIIIICTRKGTFMYTTKYAPTQNMHF